MRRRTRWPARRWVVILVVVIAVVAAASARSIDIAAVASALTAFAVLFTALRGERPSAGPPAQPAV